MKNNREKALNYQGISKVEIMSYLLVGLIVMISLNGLEAPNNPSSSGSEVALNIISQILQPSKDLIFSFEADSVPYLLIETIAIAFLGTLFGAVNAFILSLLASNNITGGFVSRFFKTVITIIRTIPGVIYAIIFVSVAGLGPMAGVLTFSIVSIGMVSKLFIDIIEEVDAGVLEAMDAQGLGRYKKIRFGVIPQVASNFYSIVIYRFEINIKDASILGIVGAGGIGTPLIFAMQEFRWSDAGAYLFGLVILVLIIEYYSTKLRHKLQNG